ncbi:hypothetical protein K432DRAFT_325292 [Lepidopterella palustris CBS 459.81]|uniref:Uncharacterized protein n=1 Tax=Lepidopterella palustris CBS 459.81 TaxID=1314670 RepID=A0A8E2EDI1_9PEZI|nr:hypothetical protein K432DRAFT_325292 [Lepidopterella palustris CBS 459.81]
MSKRSSANHLGKYIQPTLTSNPVEVDPAAPGTVIRWALGIESAMNIVFGVYMMAAPDKFLNLMVSKPSDITPTSTAATQQYAAVVFGMTVPMILGIPNTRRAIESRHSLYYMLGSAEVCIISLALYQAYGPGKGSGFSPDSLFSLITQLGPALLWRCFVLFKKPEWFGRYRENQKDF